MGVNIDVQALVQGEYIGANALAGPDQHLDVKAQVSYLTGSGAGQAAIVHTDSRSIAASGSESLNLTTMLDAFGVACAFAVVKTLMVKAHPTNANNVLVGDAASDAFVGPFGATGVVTLQPGGVLLISDPTGFAVTASTADLLKVANSGSGTAVGYDIVIIGA